MKKFTEIEVDKNEPWNDDILERDSIASFITDIIKNANTPFVFNINSPWGTGKTFFIKRLIAQLSNDFPCIYFNAWENDYNINPFIVFMSDITDQLYKLFPTGGKKSKINSLAKKSGRIMLRAVPLVLKGGIRYVLGENGWDEVKDVLSKKTEKEFSDDISKIATDILKETKQSQKSVKEFKKSFETTIENLLKKTKYKIPLIIFIDELDRCKPTFTIELLENIKHIFSIPNIIFILSTDLEQIGHSLKVIYGNDLDSNGYLRRIIDQTLNLPIPSYIKFARLLDKKLPLNENIDKILYIPNFGNHFEVFALMAEHFNLTLREQEQCYLRLHTAITYFRGSIHLIFLCYLIMVQYKASDIYFNFRSKKLNTEGFWNESYAKIRKSPTINPILNIVHTYLANMFDKENLGKKIKELREAYSPIIKGSLSVA